MTVLYEAQDRISYALEGAMLAAEDLRDLVRERTLIVLAGVAAIAAVVVIALTAAGGSGAGEAGAAAPSPAPTGAGEPKLVDEQGFSLSLPDGWNRAKAPVGASFAATSVDGLAQTTLWAERAPNLDFDAFVAQSMDNLDEIAANVRISDEVKGPTNAARITELRAEVPLDGGLDAAYHVVLRAAGPFRYYLATSLQPGVSSKLVADAELLGTSFRPQVLPKPGK